VQIKYSRSSSKLNATFKGSVKDLGIKYKQLMLCSVKDRPIDSNKAIEVQCINK
jgi:hypothetical protein